MFYYREHSAKYQPHYLFFFSQKQPFPHFVLRFQYRSGLHLLGHIDMVTNKNVLLAVTAG